MSQDQTRNSNKPSYRISYPIRDGFESIGAAWVKNDGLISIKLNGRPHDGWDGALLLHPINDEGAAQ